MVHQVIFYPAGESSNIIVEFYRKLNVSTRRKIIKAAKYLEEYGIVPEIGNIKKLKGYDFWEVRILGKDNIRLFIIEIGSSIYVLNIFRKKTQSTPLQELKLTQKRLHALKNELDR